MDTEHVSGCGTVLAKFMPVSFFGRSSLFGGVSGKGIQGMPAVSYLVFMGVFLVFEVFIKKNGAFLLSPCLHKNVFAHAH